MIWGKELPEYQLHLASVFANENPKGMEQQTPCHQSPPQSRQLLYE